jgi:ABC-2 type transport system ATP-binding protein
LSKKYRKAETFAVNDISFYVEKGSFFSLLGPNGAGKTTTISILTTLLSKTSGTATIAGYDVESQADKVRQNIGVIFQNPSLDLHLTAEENIRFHANLYNLYPYRPSFSLMPKSYQQRVKKLAKVLSLEADIFKPTSALSGGMKRKLEIIRSLMHNPKVLFLDEPTTGLDPISRQNLWQYLQEVRSQEKITIFLTTHYLDEAEGSDYLCILNHGKIVAKGTPDEIKADLIENYILLDSKTREKLRLELDRLHFKLSGSGPFRIQLEGKTAQGVIQKIKTPLSVLKIHQPTLEQAYVKIINSGRKS